MSALGPGVGSHGADIKSDAVRRAARFQAEAACPRAIRNDVASCAAFRNYPCHFVLLSHSPAACLQAVLLDTPRFGRRCGQTCRQTHRHANGDRRSCAADETQRHRDSLEPASEHERLAVYDDGLCLQTHRLESLGHSRVVHYTVRDHARAPRVAVFAQSVANDGNHHSPVRRYAYAWVA